MSDQIFSSDTPNIPTLGQCAPRMTPDGTNAAPSLVEQCAPTDEEGRPIMIVDGKITATNLVEPNAYHCLSAWVEGELRGGGHFSGFVTSRNPEINIFSVSDPNPIDPSLVDGKKWQGTAFLYEDKGLKGTVKRFKTLIFDIESGPVTTSPRKIDSGYATNPLMSARPSSAPAGEAQ